MPTPVRVLVLEAQPGKAELLVRELCRAGYAPAWRRVRTEGEFLALLDPTVGLIFAECLVPPYGAFSVLARLRDRALDIPVIIVTDPVHEDLAVECIKQGATDYLFKDRLGRLGAAVAAALEQRRLREAHRRVETELHLHTSALEAAANAVVITDPTGAVLWANPAFTGLTGYELQEVLGQNLRLLKSGAHDPAFYGQLWETIQADKVWHGEMMNRRKDGSLYTEEQTITPVRDAQGVLSHFIAIKQDVTARKEAEEALAESEERYRRLVEDSPDAIVLHDGERFLYLNPAAVQLHGADDVSQLVGKEVLAYIHPEDRGSVGQRIHNVQASDRQTPPTVQRLQRLDGGIVYVEAVGGPCQYRGRRAVQAILRDVTERIRAEEALRRYAARLETLREIDRAVLAAHSPREIAEAALHHVRRLVSCQRASIAVFNKPTGMATLLAVSMDGETRLGSGAQFPLDEFPFVQTLSQGRIEKMEDLHTLSRASTVVQALAAEGIRSFMCVPLVAHGGLIGSLNVGAAKPGVFTAADSEVASEVADQLAVAIQQARLHATAVRRSDELGALLRATRSIMSGLDLQEILERIVAEAAGISHCPHVKVLLIDRARGVLRTMAARGTSMSVGGELPLGTGLSGLVATSGEALFVPDCPNDPRNLLAAADRDMGLVTYLGLPIMAHEEVVGVLTFNTTTSRQYSPEELAYLTSFADQAAIAIQHAQLFTAQQHAARAARSLYEVAHSLATSLNVEEVLGLIVRKTMELLGTAHAQVALWEEATQTLHSRAVRGTQADSVRSYIWRLGEGVNGIVAETRAPLVVNDYQSFPHRLPGLTELTADIGAPLLYRGRLLGVLNSHSTEPGWTFTQEHVDLLTSFADQAAVSLENARLYEQLQHHAEELEQRVQERTRELAAANQQLQEASRHKSEFLANMSHEIRTPLNAIIGFADLLQDQQVGPLNAKQARWLGHIIQSGKHLVQLIGDILDIAKVEAGKFVLQPEPLAVPQILEDILVIVRGLATKKGQEIQTDIAADLPPLIADPVRFKQVLFNLLSNAVKFTPERGTITVTARIADCRIPNADLKNGDPGVQSRIANRESGMLEIRVTDTGIGISAQDIPLLFKEFVQLQRDEDQHHEGTGLGLALSRRLVEMHGGRTWAVSEGEDKGSTFTVLLPFSDPKGVDRQG